MTTTRTLPSGKVAILDDRGRVVSIQASAADTPVSQDALPSFAELQAKAVPPVEPALGAPSTRAMTSASRLGPTEKQRAFFERILRERMLDEGGAIEHLLAAFATKTKAEASEMIDGALALPKLKQATGSKGADLTKGDIHVLDGQYLRVHVSQSSGKPYVVRANFLATAIWHVDEAGVETIIEPGTVEWEYAPGLASKLSAATLATAEQAKHFATLAGRCVFCSTPIDTPESTAVGYGPVCASKRGLPWGSTVEQVAITSPPQPASPEPTA